MLMSVYLLQTSTLLSLKVDSNPDARVVFGCCVVLQGTSRGSRGRFGSPGDCGYQCLKDLAKLRRFMYPIKSFIAKCLYITNSMLDLDLFSRKGEYVPCR